MYDISMKMEPLARDMAAGLDLWRTKSQISDNIFSIGSAGYSSQFCNVCVQVEMEVLADEQRDC